MQQCRSFHAIVQGSECRILAAAANCIFAAILTVSPNFHKQENPHKLTDQQQALTHGQNPLPVYLCLNVKEKLSSRGFRGKNHVLHFCHPIKPQEISLRG